MTKRLKPQVVGNVGMYYVCHKLSLMGWNVLPTARNARGIDIVAYDESGERFVGIQVKSLSKQNAVPLGTSLEKIMGDYWVIVMNAVVEGGQNVFVMTPEEVKENASRDKGGKRQYWLEKKMLNKSHPGFAPEFAENWDKIGRGDCEK